MQNIDRLSRDVFSGVVSGILLAIIAVTCANLIFTSVIINYLYIGIILTLVGSVIMSLVVTLGSELEFNILGTQDTFAIIAALTAGAIITNNANLDNNTVEHRI